MNLDSKIYIAGHNGMVGSAIFRNLKENGYANVVVKTRQELDLTRQADVEKFFLSEKPEYVFLGAAKVGGIMANNTYPADFIYQNLAIQTNIIHTAHLNQIKRLLFLGSVCIYPKHCPQPIKEDYLLTGPLEPTNEPYAIAKIAGIKFCESYNRQYETQFLCAMPTNLYGQGDNFDLQTSHVLPALIRKFHEAKTQGTPVTLWGTGLAKREFLYVEDCAQAAIFLMNLPDDQYAELKNDPVGPLINVGCGEDITIQELAHLTQKVVGGKTTIRWDDTKPDGTPKRKLDITRLQKLGWTASISLEEGIKLTYDWYLRQQT